MADRLRHRDPARALARAHPHAAASWRSASRTSAARCPSLALIAFFVAYLGTGFANVTLALVLLAIPPILTNTYVAVTQVERDTVDAARGMGMTGAEIVRKVELPLALPLIFGGIKTSAVNVIATATIAPLAGINTLGDPIINVSGYGDTGRLAAAIVRGVARNLHGASPRRRSARRDARRAEARTRHRVTAHETPISGGKQRHEEETPWRRASLALLLLLTASFAIAACGDDDDDSSSTGARQPRPPGRPRPRSSRTRTTRRSS